MIELRADFAQEPWSCHVPYHFVFAIGAKRNGAMLDRADQMSSGCEVAAALNGTGDGR
jgi:hypothetical protein